MDLLISIHPKYSNLILEGKKTVELRKSIFKQDIEKIYIYSTSPRKEVIGYFNFTGYDKLTPSEIFEKYEKESCIDKNSFDEYFKDKDVAYAIYIKDFVKLNNPKKLKNGVTPPQSFYYIKGDLF